MLRWNTRSAPRWQRFLVRTGIVVIVGLATGGQACAQGIDDITSPNVTAGELSVEYNGSTTFDHDHAKNNLLSHEVALEYGMSDRLALQLNTTFDRQPYRSTRSDLVGFQSVYQFFEQDEYFGQGDRFHRARNPGQGKGVRLLVFNVAIVIYLIPFFVIL